MDGRLAKKFGKVLREIRNERNLSQEQLALKADVDRTFVSMLERGVRQPTIETIFRLAKVLKTQPSLLIKRIE